MTRYTEAIDQMNSILDALDLPPISEGSAIRTALVKHFDRRLADDAVTAAAMRQVAGMADYPYPAILPVKTLQYLIDAPAMRVQKGRKHVEYEKATKALRQIGWRTEIVWIVDRHMRCWLRPETSRADADVFAPWGFDDEGRRKIMGIPLTERDLIREHLLT
jgi:hypothetical protein